MPAQSTSRPLGHDEVRALLETSLPRVTLLRGPKAVGKWALAEHLVRHYGIGPADLREVEHLTTTEAHAIQEFVSTRPAGEQRVVVARLDSASDAALQALLKTLEEPPADTSFVLMSEKATLPTVESRAEVFALGLLSEAQTEEILTRRYALAPSVARQFAERGDGTATLPDSVAEEKARGAVSTLLKALTDADDELLNRVVRSWDRRAHDLLGTWVIECLTKKWRCWRETDAPALGADPTVARTLMISLRREARPQIALRAAVAPVMAARRNRV